MNLFAYTKLLSLCQHHSLTRVRWLQSQTILDVTVWITHTDLSNKHMHLVAILQMHFCLTKARTLGTWNGPLSRSLANWILCKSHARLGGTLCFTFQADRSDSGHLQFEEEKSTHRPRGILPLETACGNFPWKALEYYSRPSNVSWGL